MKKLILIVMLALTTAISSNAQIALYSANNKTNDTITDAETLYMTSKVNALTGQRGDKYACTFRVLNNVSGTSTFTAILQGSWDNSTWFNMSPGGLGTDGVNSDSLTVSSAADLNTYKITVNPNAVKFVNGATRGTANSRVNYIRVKIVATGTQSTYIDRFYVYLVD